MKYLKIEVGDKCLEVETYDDGDIEIAIHQEHFGWNEGGKAIAGDIILTTEQAKELLYFLQSLTKKGE